MPEIRLGKYQHYKTREFYEVIGVAYNSETLEPLVVYRALYGDHSLWARPYAMFTGTVTVDGKTLPRFQKVG